MFCCFPLLLCALDDWWNFCLFWNVFLLFIICYCVTCISRTSIINADKLFWSAFIIAQTSLSYGNTNLAELLSSMLLYKWRFDYLFYAPVARVSFYVFGYIFFSWIILKWLMNTCIFCTPCYRNEIKKIDVGRARSTHWGHEKCVQILVESQWLQNRVFPGIDEKLLITFRTSSH